MRPAAARPATVFTSIGKKVITTTTAALDCQSKPNHITMIGAMPMIGSAETKLPSGSSPRRRKGTRSARMATRKPAPQPMRPAGEHGAEEGLDEVGPRGSAARRRSAAPIADGLGRSTGGTPKPTVATSHRNRTQAPKAIATARSSRRWRIGSSSSTAASASTASQAASHRLSTRSQKPSPGRAGDARAVHLGQGDDAAEHDQAHDQQRCGADARRPTAPMARKPAASRIGAERESRARRPATLAPVEDAG